ncbi:MAG: ribosome biogenesis GTP-binding protein YihA/YsxC [Bacteroidia bacterium]
MIIKKAIFTKSSAKIADCPKPVLPEYAFIGRSNVGKSSLINLLCNNNKLAHTSSSPGKTKIINHFLVNEAWYIVDLPGYGYAKTSKTNLQQFEGIIIEYISKRENLSCLFVLIDIRLPMQQIDAEFMQWLGEKEIPFSIIFTKSDKLSKTELRNNLAAFLKKLSYIFEGEPNYFITSAQSRAGKEDVLGFIGEHLKTISKN